MTISEQDEREAREWLAATEHPLTPEHIDAKHRATILALLDRPRMPAPAELPWAVLSKMRETLIEKMNFIMDRETARALYAVWYDHYHQPPKPKKVEGWHIAYTDGTSEFSTDWGFIEALHGDLSVSRIVHLREVEGDQ